MAGLVGENRKAVVIEHEFETRAVLSRMLKHVGFVVQEASTGEEGVDLATRSNPEVIVVGYGLRDIDGHETLRRISARVNALLLAVLETNDEFEVVHAYDSGADGVVAKPIKKREFRARVDSFVRRQDNINNLLALRERRADQILRHRNLALNVVTWQVTIDDVPVKLTATEFSLLRALLVYPGHVRSKKELARILGDEDELGAVDLYVSPAAVRSIEVHIANLRRKLGDSAREERWIETVRGVGYRMIGPHETE
ncbi:MULTISPECIES: response regulator transcription factor [Glutamicibacter]|uniref:Response regulator transcription factor n=1 Tax=Glutamicibacter bergerei TaxID=256702 RepID=A0ABV9MQM0_9MICC|nr:DNA-binding response regulator [Micrococcaceae bacterium]